MLQKYAFFALSPLNVVIKNCNLSFLTIGDAIEMLRQLHREGETGFQTYQPFEYAAPSLFSLRLGCRECYEQLFESDKFLSSVLRDIITVVIRVSYMT